MEEGGGAGAGGSTPYPPTKLVSSALGYAPAYVELCTRHNLALKFINRALIVETELYFIYAARGVAFIYARTPVRTAQIRESLFP